jgi:hypothetical protein
MVTHTRPHHHGFQGINHEIPIGWTTILVPRHHDRLPEIISSHRMEKILKKVILTLLHNSMPFKQLRPPHLLFILNIQSLLSKHQSIFDNPQGLPPSCGTHDHSIPLVPRRSSSQCSPLSSPIFPKNEIEKIVQNF